MLPAALCRLQTDQAGVVARRQVIEAGLDDSDIERLLRRREWSRVHPGVYVDHTGPLTQAQRHWAAVLSCWPAALDGRSALDAFGLRNDRHGRSPGHRTPGSKQVDPMVHVAIAHPRKAVEADGVRVHRVVGLENRVLWNLGPPRLRIEEAVLTSCAEESSRSAALAVAADACQQRRTTAARLLEALDGRIRLTHGAWLRRVLRDVASGSFSLLEHGYLNRVERAHGLPHAHRQLELPGATGRSVYRDVGYVAFGVVVELDGRIGHEWTSERWSDMDRDLDAGANGQATIRLGWRHVWDTPCGTADEMARGLARRGWSGAARSCGIDCPVGRPGVSGWTSGT